VIPLLLLLAAADAPAMTPVEAERAFAADAQKIGQWTAFRKWSTDDATMFVPQPANAHEFLKDKKDPPKAIDWWPTASWVSCDGKLAVNTGGWKQPDGSVGYFTTVWRKQPDGGWKWVLDLGDAASQPRERPAQPKVRQATCPGPELGPPAYQEVGPSGVGAWEAFGNSDDKSISWHWIIWPGGRRELAVEITNKGTPAPSGLRGGSRELVIDDKIAAPK
jgi:hypothetical protein